jgi:hypothetical protein
VSKEPGNGNDNMPAEDPQFQTAHNSRATWLLIGGFVAVLVLLLGTELLRRI